MKTVKYPFKWLANIHQKVEYLSFFLNKNELKYLKNNHLIYFGGQNSNAIFFNKKQTYFYYI